MKKPGPQKAPTEADQEIGQTIRSHRLHSQLSQTALAQQIGVTFQQVQKYEKGVNRVSAGRLQRIADTLGVPISTFYASSKERNENISIAMLSRPALAVARCFDALDRPDRDAIARLVFSLTSRRS